MNELELQKDELQRRFLSSTSRLEAPLNVDGEWTLDLQSGARWFVVAWLPQGRFAVSEVFNTTGYGEGADEVFSDSKTALERVAALITGSDSRSTESGTIR